MPGPNPPPIKENRSSKPLNEFVDAAKSFVDKVSSAMIEAAGEDEDALLIEGTSKVVIEQFGAVTDELIAAYGKANAAGRRDADELLRLQRGALMARTGEETATRALARGAGGGFLAWIGQYLEEIKKLIRFIFEEIIGWYPRWLDKLLKLIDELWELIVAILGGIFGSNRMEIADELSRRAVNTSNELTALARLQMATRNIGSEDED